MRPSSSSRSAAPDQEGTTIPFGALLLIAGGRYGRGSFGLLSRRRAYMERGVPGEAELDRLFAQYGIDWAAATFGGLRSASEGGFTQTPTIDGSTGSGSMGFTGGFGGESVLPHRPFVIPE